MALAVIMGDDRGPRLRELLADELPDVPVYVWPEIPDRQAVRFALVWKHPVGALATLPRPGAAMSYGAGVDFLVTDPDADGLCLGRFVDPGLGEQIAAYVVAHIVAHARGFDALRQDQQRGRWAPPARPSTLQVGILGLGAIGLCIGEVCAKLGFGVRAWTRQSASPAIACAQGPEGLASVTRTADFVVNTLPLTPSTAGVLDASLFAAMSRHAVLINVGRGEHLIEADLLAALDAGQLAGAVLDVFQAEPLPADHPFWHHPKIRISPHVAGLTDPARAARAVAQNYRSFIDTGTLSNPVDPAQGY